MAPTAVRDADRFVVNGVVDALGAQVADWMFCLVSSHATRGSAGTSLLLIDMQSPGIRCHPNPPLDARQRVSCVTLSDVRVPVTQLVGAEGQGSIHTEMLLDHEPLRLARVAGARVQLGRVRQIAAETPDGGGSVADDEAFQRKYGELEVELLGLETLELRVLAAVEDCRTPAAEASTLDTILEIRGAGIGQRIADLMVETLGYYALPYPDQLLIDNEGPVGHDYALSAIQGWLARSVAGSVAGSIEEQKNIIARSALEQQASG
jgi:alkylation response protein AidB-like acyl-CoA dehydrogenase